MHDKLTNLLSSPMAPEMRLIVGKGRIGEVILGKTPGSPGAAKSAASHQGDHGAPLDLLLLHHHQTFFLLDHHVILLLLDHHHLLLLHLETLMKLQACGTLLQQHLETTERDLSFKQGFVPWQNERESAKHKFGIWHVVFVFINIEQFGSYDFV